MGNVVDRFESCQESGRAEAVCDASPVPHHRMDILLDRIQPAFERTDHVVKLGQSCLME
jgi:hypothetical protein